MDVYWVIDRLPTAGAIFLITESLERAQQAARNIKGVVVKLTIAYDSREG